MHAIIISMRIFTFFLLIGDMSTIFAKHKKSREVLVECDKSTSVSERTQLARKHLQAGKSAVKSGFDKTALHHLESALICNDSGENFVSAEATRLRDTLLRSSSSVTKGADRANDLAAADAAFHSGVQLAGSGDTVGAARAFARAVELHPKHALAWSNLGVVRQQASLHRHSIRPLVGLTPCHPLRPLCLSAPLLSLEPRHFITRFRARPRGVAPISSLRRREHCCAVLLRPLRTAPHRSAQSRSAPLRFTPNPTWTSAAAPAVAQSPAPRRSPRRAAPRRAAPRRSAPSAPLSFSF
jgi:hypothetical protein